MQTQISYFCWDDNLEAKNYPLIRSIEPTGKFQKFGNIYLMSNFWFSSPPLKNEKDEIKEFIKKILIQIEDIYYNPIESIKSPEDGFENLLNKINDWLKREMLRSQKLYFENMELCLVLAVEEKIFSSKFGGFQIFLVSDNQFEFLEPKEKEKDKKFINIISGNLSEGDTLFFTLENIFDYFAEDKISELLKTNNPLEFQAVLENRSSSFNFNLEGLIIQMKETKNNKEEDEKKLLAENKKEEQLKPEKKEVKEIKEVKVKPPKKELANLVPENGYKIEQPLKNKKVRLPHLSSLQKAIFILIIIALIIFAQNISVSKKNSQIEKEERLLTEVQTKFNFRKEQLSVVQTGGEIKAILKEMEIILEEFPQNNELQKEKYADLKREWLALINQYFKYQTIDLTPLFSLKDLEINFNPTNLLMNGDYFYVINKTTNHLWQINLLNKKSVLYSTSLEGKTTIDKLISWDKDNLLVLDETKHIGRFNLKTKTYTPLTIELAQNNTEISDISLYGGRLYVLDKTAHQIFKYPETIIGFSKGTPWILENQPRNFTNIASFAINGNIYLLRNDGIISKFYLGEQKEFKQKDVFPEIENAALLYTHSETDNLYFTDKETERIIIYNKEGELVSQYKNPAFANLKSIEEKNGVITLLAGTEIYQISD